MANQYNRKILEDGWRNAIVQITGTLDTSDADLSPAIQISDFTNNDDRAGRVNGLRVDEIQYSIGDGLQVTLTWEATSEELLAAIAGRGKLNQRSSGGLIPNRQAIGYIGDINLRTTGFNVQAVPPQNFTVLIKMVKLYAG